MNETTLYNAFAKISDTLTDTAYDAKKPARTKAVIKAAAAALSLGLVVTAAVLAVTVFSNNGTGIQETPCQLIATELVYTSKNSTSAPNTGEDTDHNYMRLESYYDASAPNAATVTVDGNEYTGTYDITLIHRITEAPADERLYTGRKDNINYGFGLNAETGALMSFCCYDDAHDGQKFADLYLEVGATHWNEFETWRETDEQSIPEELEMLFKKYTDLQNARGEPIDPDKAKTIAEEYASVYLGEHADEYAVETDWSEYNYHYYARRMINGLKSKDYLHIIINNLGQLEVLNAPYLGSFDGIESLPFSIEEANAVIAEKANEKSKSISGFTQYEYKSVTPVVLQDGRAGLIYEVVFNKVIGGRNGGERYFFFVSPEKE